LGPIRDMSWSSIIALPDDPRVRDQVVHPHRLDAYDNLAARAGKKDDDE